MSAKGEAGREFVVTGRVQGVGFRWHVRERALALGVRGTVENLPDGRVRAVAVGSDGALDALADAIRRGPPGSVVQDVTERAVVADDIVGSTFTISR